ncbi:hypothetical protein CVT25_008055 [Psilocybe cyanescens]|uniref:Uncharacterized protein n=1 Tax=Psilocybe cyanescens TaxID=93625 RepID=A0A409XG91_PSICY|nr:hypothetical protein CVT25_008055 [Psilocybe cyanescens]
MTIFAVLRVKEKVAVIVVGDAFDIEDGVVVGDIVVNVNGGAVGTEISIVVRDLVVNVCAVVRVDVVSVDANSVELHPKYFEWMKPLRIVTVNADDVGSPAGAEQSLPTRRHPTFPLEAKSQ